MIPPLPRLLAVSEYLICTFLEGLMGQVTPDFSDVASWSPSWYWEQECGTFLQESAEKPEIGTVEKNQLNTALFESRAC